MADETTDAPSGDEPEKLKDNSPGARALKLLRAAKRSAAAAESPEDPRAQHLLAEANVLAMLDLADAIRSHKS
jgi:hypothetical protein